jgi:hypothetical protein
VSKKSGLQKTMQISSAVIILLNILFISILSLLIFLFITKQEKKEYAEFEKLKTNPYKNYYRISAYINDFTRRTYSRGYLSAYLQEDSIIVIKQGLFKGYYRMIFNHNNTSLIRIDRNSNFFRDKIIINHTLKETANPFEIILNKPLSDEDYLLLDSTRTRINEAIHNDSKNI